MHQVIKSFLLITGVFLVTILLIVFPQEALHASLRGIVIWSEVVFPSLLPFLIMAELLISLGAISIIGVLFEPFMRPIFNVPGTGSLALMMGFVSGYPTGAKITAKLRDEEELSRKEAERLISFTNASSPLFILGAIAVGFFNDAKIGLLIALSHYGGNIVLGIILKYLYPDPKGTSSPIKDKKIPYIKQIKQELQSLKTKPSIPLGDHLGNAVHNSVQTLIIIGGFITLFSVITSLFLKVKLLTLVANLIKPLFLFLQFPFSLSLPFLTGIFEISIGVEHIAQYKEVDLLYPLLAVSFLLGFNGLSIQAQVASIISKTDIRFSRYFYARILHGILATLITFLLYGVFFTYKDHLPTLLPIFKPENELLYSLALFKEYGFIITFITLGITVLISLKNLYIKK